MSTTLRQSVTLAMDVENRAYRINTARSVDDGTKEEEILIENISAEATQHVSDAGWSYLLELYTSFSLFAMALAIFCCAWGFQGPASVLTVIGADIGSTPSSSSLFSIVWTIGATTGFIIIGHVSDIFGRRWTIIVCNTLGLLGGVIASTAHSLQTLSGANILIGLAAAAQLSYFVIATEVMPNKHKIAGMALVTIISLPAQAFGPYAARSLCQFKSWRWIYYIYILVLGVAIIFFLVFYFPKEAASEISLRKKIEKIDLGGMVLAAAGLTLFILGISLGGNPDPWKSGKVLGLLLSGIAVLAVFIAYEAYMPLKKQLLPTKSFRDIRGTTVVMICSAVGGIVFVTLNIIWPTEAVTIYSWQSTSWKETAWLTTTIGAGVWCGMVFIGPLWGIIRKVKMQLIVCNVVMTAFIGALSTLTPYNKVHGIIFSFFAALPVGCIEQQTAALIQLLAPSDADLGQAFGSMAAIRQAAAGIGTAICISVLTAKIPRELGSHVTPAALGAGLPADSLPALFQALGAGTETALMAVPGITPSILATIGAAARDGQAAAYAYVYYVALAFSVASTIASLFLSPLDHTLNAHVPKRIVRQDRGENKVEEKTQELSTAKTG